jgi:acyl-CoA thioesterase
MDAIERARRVGETMFAVDTASKDTMGMELLSCEPGRAVIRMTVQGLHLNGHQICHGGFIFTLADSTFAFACNSYNRNTVAAGASIEFLKPAHAGDVLTCEAVEQVMSGRHGVYDMKVTNQRSEVVAMFRGKSAQIPGTVFPE